MSDSETSFPEQPTRWGRLKRSHSHDDADSPIIKSPRNFLNKKGVQSTRDLSTSKTKPKNGGRVFRPRRLNNNDDTISTPGETRKHASGDLPRVKISSKLNRFRKAGASTSLDGILMSGVSSSNPVGRFGLRRRKGGKTEDGAPISNQNCEQVDSDVSDCDGMSSSGDGSVANPKYRPSNRGRRPAQKQPDELPTISTGNSSFGGAVGSRSQGSALRTGKFQPRGENLPAPRRAVSFGDSNFNETEVEPCRQRAASSDQAPEAEDEAAKFGYNLLDFPIHNSTSMTAMPSVSTGAAKRHASERARYSIYHGSSATKKRLRVRPYHCFAGEPMYMTEEEIYTDSLVTSKSFVQLKSYLAPSAKRSTPSGPLPDTIEQLWGNPEQDGRIGALRVEILGCVSLNRTKPDVSAYAVCGDSAFCTDVISNYRSPMWPSVSRRACTFPIHHAFAKLYVGVFDVCIRKNKENDAFCGRVSIDLAAIRPNTEYDTTMPLRASTFVYDKRKRGVVRLRFSLHWFNERAAVTSYFKPVRGIASSCPMVDGQPTIPCADPKTFRNVAVTVYGQDLPGKYSKHAFRATMRELILYQQNAQQIIKSQVLDAVLYEKPWISLYMFCGAMYCVIFNSMSKVPAIFMGYFLILYIENYFHFVENKTFNLGYKPLTIAEVLTALLMMNQGESRNKRLSLESIKVEKRAKRRGPSKEDVDTDADIGDSGEIVPLDHREFPFADRDAYPKFSVEDSLAPGTSKGGTGRLHGRLSVYYHSEAPTPTAGAGADGDEESDSDSDRDDETVMTESNMLGDSMYDLDSDDDEDEGEDGVDFNYKRAKSFQSASGSLKQKRLRLGPPQDTEVRGKKVPPQLQLKKVEALLYKFSLGVSVELVHARPRAEHRGPESTDGIDATATGMTSPSPEVLANVKKRAKKVTCDDFDKLLGLESGSGNPIHRIMSSFMGPLMRMIRVAVFLIRVSFNVTTWRDPFLSFWVLMTLTFSCIILLVIPWRFFFMVSSMILLGPQNICLRKYIEKRAAAKEIEESERVDEPAADRRDGLTKRLSARFGKSRDQATEETADSKDVTDEKTDTRRGFFAKRRQNETRRTPSRQTSQVEAIEEADEQRPAFESALHGQTTSSKKLQPKAVAIPYSRLKKERFYDWPPDPTVSRATPIILYPRTADDSLTASVPSFIIDNDEPMESARQQESSDLVPADIPEFISFPSTFA